MYNPRKPVIPNTLPMALLLAWESSEWLWPIIGWDEHGEPVPMGNEDLSHRCEAEPIPIMNTKTGQVYWGECIYSSVNAFRAEIDSAE